jgi:hypothetical protein
MSTTSPIDRLLAELRVELAGLSWRARRTLLAEARAHLDDAAAEEQGAGLDRLAAERRAGERFGSAAEYGRVARADAPRRRRGLAAGLAVTGIAMLAAVAVIGLGGSGAKRAPSARAAAPAVSVAGGTATERAVARRVVSGLARSAVVAVRFGGPPTAGRRRHGTWLYVTVAAASLRTSQPAQWQGRLVEGGYRNLAYTSGLPDLAGVGFSLRLPDGSTRPAGDGLPGGNPPPATARTATRAAITARVRSAARRAGLALRSLRLLHPYQYAPMIVLEARSQRGFAHRLLVFQTHLGLTGIAGSMLQVISASGHLVYADTQANQTGASTLYADPHWYTPIPWLGFGKRVESRPIDAAALRTLR